MNKQNKKYKNQSIMIVKARKDKKTHNFGSTSTRAKTETEKRGKEDNINSELLRRRTQILAIEMYVHQAIDLLKQEQNLGYAVDGFITNVKELQRKEYLRIPI